MSHLAPSHVTLVTLKVVTDLFFFSKKSAGKQFNHIDKKKQNNERIMYSPLETITERHIFFFLANHTDLSDIWPVQQKHKFCQGHDLVYKFLVVAVRN